MLLNPGGIPKVLLQLRDQVFFALGRGEVGALLGVDGLITNGPAPLLWILRPKEAKPNTLRNWAPILQGDSVVPFVPFPLHMLSSVEGMLVVVGTSVGKALGGFLDSSVKFLGDQLPNP